MSGDGMIAHAPSAPISKPVSEPFVMQLRTRGDGLDLSAGASDAFLIRAQVHEAWNAVRVRVAPGTPVVQVKRAALAALLGPGAEPDAYMSKLHGREVHDEGRPVIESGMRAGSILFIHSRRRRAVR